MKNLFVLLLASGALLGACGDDDGDSSGGHAGSSTAGNAGSSSGEGGGGGDAGGSGTEGGTPGEGGASGEASLARTFTLTIENVAERKAFTSSGVFDTPVGDSAAGPLTPGKSYSFTIDAGRKQKLSLATMLAASNDLFFGPGEEGIALYDEAGDPITGFVTDQLYLWDAGTELNEEPHVGPNTVSKQAAPNTGPAENGNVVDIADTEDSFDYPAAADVMTVYVEHLEGTRFEITIDNVSSNSALQTSEGNFAAPLSPGVWVVHGGQNPLYTPGMPDLGQGLEAIAEDGNPTMLAAFAAESSGITYPASPGAWLVHTADTMPFFSEGEPDYGDGVEHIAEDGNPTMLGESLSDLAGYVAGEVFDMPAGEDMPGPITPGKKYELTFQASPGQSLSFVSMLAATNDVFIAPGASGIPLFDGDEPVAGDVTDQLYLWDAGTEANEMPGIGPNTVTNQLAADSGEPGEMAVQLLSDVDDGFTYPPVDGVVQVTLSVED